MFKYKKYKDMAAITSYDGNDKIVIIPSEIDGLKVHRIASMTFFCNEEIEEIHFPENVIIENNVIINCDNLKRVFVKDFKTMGNFIEDCEDLEVVCDSERTQKKLSKLFNFDWVSIRRLISFETIENDDGTLTISSVFIPKGETIVEIPDYIGGKKVTRLMQYLFYRKDVQKVILNNFIKEIPPYCFDGADSLEKIENIENIEVIDKQAFGSCYKLYLNLEEMKNLKFIGDRAFRYNKTIRSIKINKNIELQDAAFCGMDNLRILDLENYSFNIIPKSLCQSCGELEKVILPNHDIDILDGGFAYCYKLSNVENEDSITAVYKEGFYSCNSLVLGIDGSKLKRVGSNAFREVSFREDLKLGNVELEHRAFFKINAFLRDSIDVYFLKDYPLDSIPAYAFAYASINQVFFEKTIDVLEESAFYNSLVKRLINASFKIIKNDAFYTSRLEEFKATNELEKIGRSVFKECPNLKIIDLEDSKVESFEDALFANSANLESLKLPKNLKTLGRVFYRTTLKELIVPESITNLSTSCFSGARIERLVLGKSISEIPNDCFYGFIGNIEINGIISKIGNEAFKYANLKTLDLSNAIIKETPSNCFYGMCCTTLKLPKTLEKIGAYSFVSADIKNFECDAKFKVFDTCSFMSTSIEKFNIDFSNVELINQRAFYCCSMPKEIILKDVYIALEAFYDIKNLEGVKIFGDSTIERKNFEKNITVYIEDSKLRNKVKNRTYFKLNPKYIQKI